MKCDIPQPRQKVIAPYRDIAMKGCLYWHRVTPVSAQDDASSAYQR